MTLNRNDPLVKLARKNQRLNQIRANGSYYVPDCHPWAIKAGCERFDCPMRSLAVAPEAAPGDYLMPCDPAGDLADLLILLQHTSAPA
jgi:hypothetical protein